MKEPDTDDRKPGSLVHLLNTRQGDYDLVCGLDFDGVGMYDTCVSSLRLPFFPSLLSLSFSFSSLRQPLRIQEIQYALRKR